MLHTINTCPICNGNKFSGHLTCKDHSFSQEDFTIVKCDSCNFHFTNPRPDEKELSRYYDQDTYISHSDKASTITDRVYKIARYFTLRSKVKLINSLGTQKSMIDFGCGTGDFIYQSQHNGWQVSGLEPEQHPRQIAQQKTNVSIHADLKSLKQENQVGLITLWHVLEHLTQLNETVNVLKSILLPGGKLLLAVPNLESWDAREYHEYWAAYDVPRHLYHFSQLSMAALLKKHELKIVRTIPMKLDAFYVSLLSEKYKNGATNFFKSFINGYKSNSYAKKTGNYSSLIYIASL